MIVRSRRRSSRGRPSAEGRSVQTVTIGLALVGTIFMLTFLTGCDDNFTRITAETMLHFSHAPTNASPLRKKRQAPSFDPRIRDSLLDIYRVSPEKVWDELLAEGTALLDASPQKNVVAMEVGMYRALQCVQAAKAGLTAHCVEPSPINFQRVKGVVEKNSHEVKSRIHLHQKAAGATSGVMLDFSSSGGTGDHVGEFDPWNMKVGKTKDAALKDKVGTTVQVASVKMDDIIQDALHNNDDDRVFVLKIDTQGYEPSVFAGLEESVFQRPRVDYVLFEYWPKGMDLLASSGEDGSDVTKACIAAGILEKLQKAGYTLYALPNTSHPQAPAEARGALKNDRAPLENPTANCAFYYQLEERFPSDYKMGYWSDILAVAPNAALVQNPATEVGQILRQEQQKLHAEGRTQVTHA